MSCDRHRGQIQYGAVVSHATLTCINKMGWGWVFCCAVAYAAWLRVFDLDSRDVFIYHHKIASALSLRCIGFLELVKKSSA